MGLKWEGVIHTFPDKSKWFRSKCLTILWPLLIFKCFQPSPKNFPLCWPTLNISCGKIRGQSCWLIPHLARCPLNNSEQILLLISKIPFLNMRWKMNIIGLLHRPQFQFQSKIQPNHRRDQGEIHQWEFCSTVLGQIFVKKNWVHLRSCKLNFSVIVMVSFSWPGKTNKKTKIQKEKKDKKTKLQNDKQIKRQQDNEQKYRNTKRQRPKREFHIVMSGSFALYNVFDSEKHISEWKSLNENFVDAHSSARNLPQVICILAQKVVGGGSQDLCWRGGNLFLV